MTSRPEDSIREALRREGSRGSLAALDALVSERDQLAVRVLEEMGGRRSATPMLSAIAELRAALREHGTKEG